MLPGGRPITHCTPMKYVLILMLSALTGLIISAGAQTMNRIEVDGQPLFLNGGNIAWINFARDIGTGEPRLDLFEVLFRDVNASGGNTLRMWLHTTGAQTPAWEGSTVTGPGEHAIEDLRAILDLAYDHNVSLMLCLWSFDMLRIRNGPLLTERAFELLTDREKTQSYIDNALVPMVAALRGHPAIAAWEIFNEAEGMSVEFGWEFNKHVPMHYIQQFVNMTAGAIRRADPEVKITNGAWSFRVLSSKAPDIKAEGEPIGPRKSSDWMTVAEIDALRRVMEHSFGRSVTLDEAKAHYDQTGNRGEHRNYYSDDALIAAGGDPDGYLDFYTVHYYSWGGTAISPFHHDFLYWELDKPTAVTEFYVEHTFDIQAGDLYQVLFDRGYAGALGWQWIDHYRKRLRHPHNWENSLRGMRQIHDNHREDTELRFRSSKPAPINQIPTENPAAEHKP